MCRKRWIVTLVSATLTLSSVPVYGTEISDFSDGREAQTEIQQELQTGENNSDIVLFQDESDTFSDTESDGEISSNSVQQETSDNQFVLDGVIYQKDAEKNTCGIVGYTDEISENVVINDTVNDGERDWYVDWIQDGAFKECISVKKISFETAFSFVGDHIFDGCTNLTVECYENTLICNKCKLEKEVNIEEKEVPRFIRTEDANYFPRNADGGAAAFAMKKDSVIRRSICGIPVRYLLGVDEKVETVEIPDTVYNIGDVEENVFTGSAIKSIVFPDSVTTVIAGSYPIAQACKKLEYVDTGNGLTKIGDFYFADCPLLRTVELGTGIAAIENGAFENAVSLQEIYIPSSVKEISETAFKGIEKNLTIIADEDSCAQEYAKGMGISFKSTGKSVTKDRISVKKIQVSGNTIKASADNNTAFAQTEYEYELRRDAYSFRKVSHIKPGKEGKFVYVPKGIYSLRVRGCSINADGSKNWTAWSMPKKVTVKAVTPDQPEIKSVKVKGTTVTVVLKGGNASAYNYVLGTKNKKSLLYTQFWKNIYQTVPTVKKYISKDRKTTKVVFKNVKKGTYYLSVQGYLKKGNEKIYSLPSKNVKVIVEK